VETELETRLLDIRANAAAINTHGWSILFIEEQIFQALLVDGLFFCEAGAEDEEDAFEFSKTVFMIVSLPADAAVAVCCSIDRLIFALNPLRKAATLMAAGFLGATNRWPFLVEEEVLAGREAFCLFVWMPLIFPWTIIEDVRVVCGEGV